MLESVVRLNSFLRHLDGLVPLLLGACSSVNVKMEEIALTNETPYFVSPLVWLIPHILFYDGSCLAGYHGFVQHEDIAWTKMEWKGDGEGGKQGAQVPEWIVGISITSANIERTIELAKSVP